MKNWKKIFQVGLVAMGITITALLSGCDTTTSNGSGSKLDGKPIKVGVLYGTTGPASQSELTLQNGVKLAIDEINAKGGINGSKLEPIYSDYGGDNSMAAQKAQELMMKDECKILIGTNLSGSRLAVEPIVEQNDGLLVYGTFYEGEKPSENVLYFNSSPSQQVSTLIPYMIKNFGKKVYLVGSDYEFPKVCFKFAKEELEKQGATVVGEDYLPISQTDFSTTINKIKDAQPDVVLSCVVGNNVSAFYKQYKQYGIDMGTIPIFALGTHEPVVKGIGDAAIGSYACFSYFNSIDTPENKDFVKKYIDTFGTDTTVSNQAESAYNSVYFLAEAIKKANSTNPKDIIKASSRLEISTPAGKLKMDDNNHNAWLPMFIGRVNDKLQFDIVYKSKDLVKPDLSSFK